MLTYPKGPEHNFPLADATRTRPDLALRPRLLKGPTAAAPALCANENVALDSTMQWRRATPRGGGKQDTLPIPGPLPFRDTGRCAGVYSVAPIFGGSGLRRWHALLVMAVASLVVTGPALAAGATFGATDNLVVSTPLSQTLASPRTPGNILQGDQTIQLAFPAEFWSAVREGKLQRWEPDAAGGVPLLTTVYNRHFAPWYLPFLVVPAHLAPTVGLTIGLLVAQLGVYGLARRLGFGVAGATLAAVGYVFSGGALSLLLRIHEALVLPVVLFALHGAATEERRRARFVVLVALAVAATLSSGFPGAAFFVLYFAAASAAWLLARPAAALPSWQARLRRLPVLAAPVVVPVIAGVLLAAVMLLPTYEYLRSTPSLARTFTTVHHLALPELATAISGRFYGAPQDHDWWYPDDNAVEITATMGLVALALLGSLVVGLRAPRRAVPDRAVERFFLPASLVLLLAIYLGGPVLWLIQRLPFLDETLFSRALFLLNLCVALVAGYALDRALDRARDSSRPAWAIRLQAAALLVAVALGVGGGLRKAVALGQVREVATDLLVPLACLLVASGAVLVLRRRGHAGALVVAALAAELQWGMWGFTPTSPPSMFYPDLPAFDVLEADTGPGGQYRFVAWDWLTFWPHWSAAVDLRDARALWPTYEPYQRLVEASDPDLAPLSVGSSTFDARFGDKFDVYSPALDAVAARWLLLRPGDPPLETTAPLVVPAGPPGPLPRRIDLSTITTTVRGIVLSLAPIDADCARGWVEIEVGGVVTRRLLREVIGEGRFPLPDVNPMREVEIRATHCPVHLASDRLRILPLAPGARLHLVSTDGWQAYMRPSALPRTSLASEITVIPDPAARVATVAGRAEADPVVLARDLGLPQRLGGGETLLVEDDPDRVLVEVNSRGRGLLVLRDVAAPGWRAAVDGRPAPMVSADHAFRGVVVPAGRSMVTFTYAPSSLTVGAWGSFAGLLLLAGSAGVVRRRSRRLEGDA